MRRRRCFCLDDLMLSPEELFKIAIQNGMITEDDLWAQAEMNQRQKYLEMHEYKVWQASDGYWKTHLPDDTRKEKRRPIKRKTKEALEKEIATFYKQQETKPTVEAVFYMWANWKLENGKFKKQTYDRYETDFKRFFAQNKSFKNFNNRLIGTITEDEMVSFVLKTIMQYELTYKAFIGFWSIVKGIFNYAKNRDMTKVNVVDVHTKAELTKNMFVRKKRNDEEEAYTVEEAKIITSYLVKQEDDLASLGILLTFMSGVRIGELSALKPSDVKEEGVLHIRGTEVKVKDEAGIAKLGVQPLPKTEAGERDVVLPESAFKIIKQILAVREDGEYLFMRNGKRMRSNKFRYRLKTTCEKLGIPYLPNHKIRKTYGTALCDSHISDALIAKQMGHKDVSTTKKIYYIDRTTDEQKRDLIRPAIPWA